MPVGKSLAAERRARGLSVTDVERATKIRHGVLEALEACDWARMPAVPYVKGYIQNYVQVLGVDAAPFLSEYAEDMEQVTQEDEVHPLLRRMPVRTSAGSRNDEGRPALKRIPARAVVPHRREIHALSRRTWSVIAVVVVVALIVIWGVSSLGSRDASPVPLPPDSTSTVETTGTASTSPTSGATSAAGSSVTASAQGTFMLSVGVASGKSSWVKVTVDGQVVWENILPGGASKEWPVTREAIVRVGDPSVVTVERDGVSVEVPASAGVAEVTLEATG